MKRIIYSIFAAAILCTNTADAVDVYTFDDLQNALSNPATTVIDLRANIVATANLNLQASTGLTINGNGFYIDGQNSWQGLAVNNYGAGKSLSIGDASVFQNFTGGYGGGIYNFIHVDSGTAFDALKIGNDVTFANNTSSSHGGAVYNRAEGDSGATDGVTIGDNVTFFNNTSGNNGGGIYNYTNGTFDADSNTMTVGNGATFSNNTAANNGGGIYNRAEGNSNINNTLTIGDNATFSNNTALANNLANGEGGGGIYNYSHSAYDMENNILVIGSNAVFSGNTAFNDGGGIYNRGEGDSAAVTNTLTIGDGAMFTENIAGYQGGAIYNDASSVSATVTNTMTVGRGAVFSGNTAFNDGGAIYNRTGGVDAVGVDDEVGIVTNTLTIGDGVMFSNNTAGNGGGGIYNYTNSDKNLTSSTITIGNGATFSNNTANGIGGGAIYNRSESSYADVANTLNIGDDTTFSGNSAPNGYGGAIYNFAHTDTGTVIANDININTNGGTVLFTDNTDSTGPNDIYMDGQNAHLNISSDSGTVIFNSGIANNPAYSDTAQINKTGAGDLILGPNSVNENFTGIYNQTAGNLTNYSTSFFGGVNSIVNSNLNLWQGQDIVINNLYLDNAVVNTMDGVITNTKINNFGLGPNGAHLMIDAHGQNKIDDKYYACDHFDLKGGSYGPTAQNINVAAVNVMGAPTEEIIPLNVIDYDGDPPTYSTTVQKVDTPIYEYTFQSDGDGDYSLRRMVNPFSGDGLKAGDPAFNPQVFRGQVATMAAYYNQLLVNNFLFDHVYIDSNEGAGLAGIGRAGSSMALWGGDRSQANNYIAVASPRDDSLADASGDTSVMTGRALLAPYQFSTDEGSLWFKTYGAFERLFMTQDLNVNNNAYGTIVGADFPVKKFENGWKFLSTPYIAYNGGHQTFNGVSMFQNGGQLGFMGTATKDNFIGSFLLYGGGYANDMSVSSFTDKTGNWFAGSAIKVANNFHPNKNWIIQPTALVSYNLFGKQNWHSDFGALSMNSGFLNGINIAPGLNFIYGRETWSVFLTNMYMYNINDRVNGTAGPISLPDVSMRHGWYELGIGGTKTWNDRLLAFGQFTTRYGGRRGVGFQAGLSWRF